MDRDHGQRFHFEINSFEDFVAFCDRERNHTMMDDALVKKIAELECVTNALAAAILKAPRRQP